MTEQDIFQVEEEKPDHHFRTELPNILELLGLNPNAIAIYFKIKRPSGDNGVCTRSIPKMAKELNICENSVRKAIKDLLKPFELLGGKSLIKQKQRKKEDKSNDTNIIVVVNIWRENGDYFRSKYNKKVTPPSSHEPPPLHLMNPPPSPDEGKEEPLNKNLVKEQQPEATASGASHPSDAVVCSSIKDNILKKTQLTNTQTAKIKKQFSNLDDEIFKEAIEAFLAYEKESPIDNHMATIITALGGSNGSKPWVKKVSDEDRLHENKKRTQEVLGKYDFLMTYSGVKLAVAVCNKYIEFAYGFQATVFEYSRMDFAKAVNAFLEKSQIEVRI